MPVSVRYQFKQRFSAPAKAAFAWCTDFSPEDHKLMGEENGKRQISWISEGSVLITDTFLTPNCTVEKQKLVALYPSELRWTSTHLTGPNRHSQFLYDIKPEGQHASTLTFTALHIEHDEKADAQKLAKRLCQEDAAAWVLLAKAMANDLGTPHKGRP